MQPISIPLAGFTVSRDALDRAAGFHVHRLTRYQGHYLRTASANLLRMTAEGYDLSAIEEGNALTVGGNYDDGTPWAVSWLVRGHREGSLVVTCHDTPARALAAGRPPRPKPTPKPRKPRPKSDGSKPIGRPPKVTPEIMAQIVTLRTTGLSIQKTAQALKIGESTIRRKLAVAA